MKVSDEWWTSPQESDSGKMIMVTGHDGIDKFMNGGKYIYRIDVDWHYDPLPDGMPAEQDAKLMEKVTEAFVSVFAEDPIAVLTGIYTGDGQRNWVFYVRNLAIFNKVFNRALAELPVLPLDISAEEDPEWSEYRNMRDISYIPPEQE